MLEGIKLNLGCGTIILPGYVNIDLYNENADRQIDITKPLPFWDETIAEVRASHVLEHFGHMETSRLIKEWTRVLKRGGRFEILVPDLPACMKRFLEDKDGRRWKWWLKTIYGGQWNEGEYHKTGFDQERLIELVTLIGGMKVETIFEQDTSRDPEIHITFIKI
jgi:predicted SAM-dependent methyltransferase